MSSGEILNMHMYVMQTYNLPIHAFCSILDGILQTLKCLWLVSLMPIQRVYISHYMHWDEQPVSVYSAWLSHTSCRKLMLARVVQLKHEFIDQHCCIFHASWYQIFFALVHTSIYSYWQYRLVWSGFADRGFCLCSWHCSSQQCSTSVSHPGVHLHCSLHQKTWVGWAH